jgi:hypothetical protein
MQIREGAYYRTQGGDVVGPMKRDEADMQYPWFSFEGTWTDTGLINVNVIGCDGDIISEVYVSDTPPNAPLPDIITDQPCKTLRDEFAMAALQGMLAREDYYARHVARDAYEYADEMMEARKK